MTKDQENITSFENSTSSVLMLTGAKCSFCASVKKVLIELNDSGEIDDLQIIDIEKEMDLAQSLGVRSVPWMQIGPFELQGARSKQEIQLWLKRASRFTGITEYLEEVLAEGNIKSAAKLIKCYPQGLNNVLELMADPSAKINVRLGAGVIIEDMAETQAFKEVMPKLMGYLSNADARIRGDACHYLSLTKEASVISVIEDLLTDESEEVREIAQDSLDELRT